MPTKKEKLQTLEDKIIDELDGIEDTEVLRQKLDVLLLIVQINKFKEIKDV